MMRIVALIEDGTGRLHLAATRAPDLLRRELSARTGAAALLWCAVPPAGMAGAGIVAEALNRLSVDAAFDLANGDSSHVISVLTELCVVRPRREAHRRWGRKAFRRLISRVMPMPHAHG
jgi:hypothetical protein